MTKIIVDGKEIDIDATEAERVVEAYLNVLGTDWVVSLCRNLKLLPHSKEEIKAALQVAIKSASDEATRAKLRAAYVSLSDFQEIGNNQRLGLLGLTNVLAGGAHRSVDSKAGDMSSIISNATDAVAAIRQIRESEAQALREELQAAGL